MPPRVPEPAYPAKDSKILYGDNELYKHLGEIAVSTDEGVKKSVEKFEIPIRSGRGWVVRKGQLCTLTTPHGPQVGDLNIFSLHNHREHLWAARTRQLHASHVSTAVIVADSLKDYGVDEVGGRCHDLLGTRCDPYVNKLLSGDDFDYQCHSNLVRAILPYGRTEFDVHDVLNVFQVTGLNYSGQYFMEPSPAKPGDNFTFFAETDILCALSTCPGGDLSVHGWGEDSAKRMLETCRPLGVEVFELENKTEVLKKWTESEVAGYKGMHGLKIPVFGE